MGGVARRGEEVLVEEVVVEEVVVEEEDDMRSRKELGRYLVEMEFVFVLPLVVRGRGGRSLDCFRRCSISAG